MGKASRVRRQKKDKERQQRRQDQHVASGQPGQHPPLDPMDPREIAEALVADAVAAQLHGQTAEVDSNAGLLADDSLTGWTGLVDRALRWRLQLAVTSAWHNGWQPAEVIRQIGRELGGLPARMTADMIADEMRQYAAATVDERWTAQLAAVGAGAWWGNGIYIDHWREREGLTRFDAVRTAVELVCALVTLPPLTQLLPLPGEARLSAGRIITSDVDERMLGKIRALLAKAESTEFPEEAEALSARAQELMARYSIDHALLAAETGSKDKPVPRRIPVDNPYEAPKLSLLNVVADANRCKAIFMPQVGMATVLGFAADLDAVELLFTSLLVQATSAMVRAGSRSSGDGRSRTRAFRQSFLVSYAVRIGERLTEAAGAAERAVAEETPGRNLLPVLATREREVTEAVEGMFTNLTRTRGARVTDEEGWASGRAAADLAALHGSAELRS
ncbi:MAG TPA: DUF2786 domain-containing protein [Streptosporangiaceae bacterium]|nr:DUF2786 domain-containing protein [Streptosporangiaceae bacterium]